MTCNRCQKSEPDTSFYRDGMSRRQPCKACTAKTNAAWRKANPDKHRAIYQRNNHRHNLKRRYGISVEDFNWIRAACDGTCAICKQPETRNRRLSLDHCHVTGKIRGFLCSRCNLILGNAADDPARLRAAADYLESSSVRFLPGFKNTEGK
jgi:hypothetical protein